MVAGAQIAHCIPAPRQGIAARHLNSALLPRSTDKAWSPGAQTPHCFPVPGQSIVARRTNTALLSCSTTGPSRQAHKHRIAPLLYDRAWSPGAQTGSQVQRIQTCYAQYTPFHKIIYRYIYYNLLISDNHFFNFSFLSSINIQSLLSYSIIE